MLAKLQLRTSSHSTLTDTLSGQAQTPLYSKVLYCILACLPDDGPREQDLPATIQWPKSSDIRQHLEVWDRLMPAYKVDKLRSEPCWWGCSRWTTHSAFNAQSAEHVDDILKRIRISLNQPTFESCKIWLNKGMARMGL